MGQPVVHFELWSHDPGKVSDFYRKAFDWQIRHSPDLNYHLIETGGTGGINGGIMTPQPGSLPGNMSFYIQVDDLEKFRERIREAGGKILVEQQEVPNVGQFALFEDPDGRCMGIWKKSQ